MMTQTKFRAIANEVTWGIYDQQRTSIASVPKKIGAKRAAEIATLMAAAPDLFEALEDALRSSRKEFKLGPDGDRQHREAYAQQFAAIAKATGQ